MPAGLFVKLNFQLQVYLKACVTFLLPPGIKGLIILHSAKVISTFNPLTLSVAFHIETSHLICNPNGMTGFCMESNTGVKWVNISIS